MEPNRNERLLRAQAKQLAAYCNHLLGRIDALERENATLRTAVEHHERTLASVSHEMRTPLNSVIGFAEMLEQQVSGVLNGEQRAYVQDIHRSGTHLLTLVNNLLDLARVDTGAVVLRRELFELGGPVRDAYRMLLPDAQRSGVSLELIERCDPGRTLCEADPDRVRQIALNLLSNALKFTPDGGRVTMTVRDASEPDQIALVVEDTGVGIDPSHHAEIFEDFCQLAGPQMHGARGLGLGLGLVRRFASAMGGAVRVESELGEGARFIVTLPRSQKHAGVEP